MDVHQRNYREKIACGGDKKPEKKNGGQLRPHHPAGQRGSPGHDSAGLHCQPYRLHVAGGDGLMGRVGHKCRD